MTQEQAQAILLGLALGDALGFPVEFLSIPQIRQRYGANGITSPPNPALYTDDTQMTIAIAEALVQHGNADLDTLMQSIGENFVKWMHHPDTLDRAPGNTCLKGTRNLESGISWRKSGVPDSKGCGSAMRVAPIGYFYQNSPENLKRVALSSGIITHGHPATQAASVAAAYMIKLALDGIHPSEWIELLSEIASGISDEFDEVLQRVPTMEKMEDRATALQLIGGGWVGDEAVAMALYCVRQYPDDYVATVRLAANISGDSDSVACIAGGISAARLGLDAIPKTWQENCENQQYLLDLGKRLAITG